MVLLSLLLLLSVAGVLHTYVIYPWYVVRAAAARGFRGDPPAARVGVPWPEVAVVMSVHNEADVLPAKLASLTRQDYPGQITFHFGSDRSTDGTDKLLADFAAERAPGTCRVLYNLERRGKPATVNELVASMSRRGVVLVLTDASVMLQPDTVTELVRPMLADPEVGVTDARLLHTGTDSGGISHLEDRYIRGEVALKEAESRLYGRLVGPFGGCWALRAELFVPVPDSYLVDDFFLCMSAYAQGAKGVSTPAARVSEGVGQHLRDEFRRKRRIGAGNWQNLVYFHRLWWPPFGGGFAFAFFSHKVLRWWTPLLLATGLACVVGMGLRSGNYLSTLGVLLLTAVLGTCVPALRYFTAMNAALLLGLIDYVRGIRTNVWQPSHRQQADGPS